MKKHASASPRDQAEPQASRILDMDNLIGYILLGGVVLSMALIVTGLGWHWAATGHLRTEYSIVGMNLFEFVRQDIRQLTSGAVHPDAVISTGIAVLMLTPYVRVLSSVLYFAFVEHNWKYTLFTAFVLGVLTYSLFLR
jgi:uncharacterized membrane protein